MNRVFAFRLRGITTYVYVTLRWPSVSVDTGWRDVPTRRNAA